MIALADACRLAALGCVVALAAVSATAEEPPAPAEPVSQSEPPEPRAAPKTACLSPAETREAVRSRRFVEPYAALKSAAAQRKAEALSAKLCHSGDEFFYEITLLHHDGRLARVRLDATNGRPVPRPPRDSKEPAPKN